MAGSLKAMTPKLVLLLRTKTSPVLSDLTRKNTLFVEWINTPTFNLSVKMVQLEKQAATAKLKF
jgi:hypothetical protein